MEQRGAIQTTASRAGNLPHGCHQRVSLSGAAAAGGARADGRRGGARVRRSECASGSHSATHHKACQLGRDNVISWSGSRQVVTRCVCAAP